jgi:hypothetical protein
MCRGWFTVAKRNNRIRTYKRYTGNSANLTNTGVKELNNED